MRCASPSPQAVLPAVRHYVSHLLAAPCPPGLIHITCVQRAGGLLSFFAAVEPHLARDILAHRDRAPAGSGVDLQRSPQQRDTLAALAAFLQPAAPQRSAATASAGQPPQRSWTTPPRASS